MFTHLTKNSVQTILQSALRYSQKSQRQSLTMNLPRQIHTCNRYRSSHMGRAPMATLSRNWRFKSLHKMDANVLGFGGDRRFSSTSAETLDHNTKHSQEHDGEVFLEDHPYTLDHLTSNGGNTVEWYQRTDDVHQAKDELKRHGEVFLEDHPYTLDHVTSHGGNKVEWYRRTDSTSPFDDSRDVHTADNNGHDTEHRGEVFLEDHPYTLDHLISQGKSKVEWYRRSDDNNSNEVYTADHAVHHFGEPMYSYCVYMMSDGQMNQLIGM